MKMKKYNSPMIELEAINIAEDLLTGSDEVGVQTIFGKDAGIDDFEFPS